MNEPTTQTERLIGNGGPQVPGGLRDDITRLVEKQLKRQTRVDDAKWLSLTFGFLFLVIVVNSVLLQRSHDRLQAISNEAIVSTEKSRLVAVALRRGQSDLADQTRMAE